MQEKLPGVLKQMRLTPHTEDKHSSTSAVDTHTHTRMFHLDTSTHIDNESCLTLENTFIRFMWKHPSELC